MGDGMAGRYGDRRCRDRTAAAYRRPGADTHRRRPQRSRRPAAPAPAGRLPHARAETRRAAAAMAVAREGGRTPCGAAAASDAGLRIESRHASHRCATVGRCRPAAVPRWRHRPLQPVAARAQRRPLAPHAGDRAGRAEPVLQRRRQDAAHLDRDARRPGPHRRRGTPAAASRRRQLLRSHERGLARRQRRVFLRRHLPFAGSVGGSQGRRPPAARRRHIRRRYFRRLLLRRQRGRGRVGSGDDDAHRPAAVQRVSRVCRLRVHRREPRRRPRRRVAAGRIARLGQARQGR